MARTRKISGKHLTSLWLVFLLGLFAVPEAHSATCEEGIGVPPFLGTETVDPNVLLMIDNSASMLDLAAVGSAGICYDGTDDTGNESYDGATDYSGYFRPYRPPPDDDLEDAWYEYNPSSGRFEKNGALGEGAVDNCNVAAGMELYEASGAVCLWVDESDADNPVITRFAARGNFLNWAAASKLDIQKKVLTGGKYDSANGDIIMESRGCLNHRYVKQIGVQGSSGPSRVLSLGITKPAYWRSDTVYPAHSVVLYDPDSNPATAGDIGYYTSAGGTSNGSSPSGDAGVVWEERDYGDLTQIEIFKVTDSGVDISSCQLAIEEMASASPSLGVIKGHITDCLEATGAPTTLEGYSNAIFNQTTQDCWYMSKHPDNWTEMGPGDTVATENMTNIRNGCESVYAELEAATPSQTPYNIEKADTGYACFGANNPIQGYVGRCWDIGAVCTPVPCTNDGTDGYPVVADLAAGPYGADEVCNGGEVYYCSGNYNSNKDTCNKPWLVKLDCPSGGATVPAWDPIYGGDTDLIDGCIQQAIEDYCGYFNTPEVIDPSDQEGSVSGDYYNAPAILIEAAAEAQLDKPLLTMNGRISSTDPAPNGILKTFAPKLRFGALAFNQEGQLTECDPTGDDNLLIDCENKLDGAQIISYMDISDAHTTQLLAAINDTKANAWTPLAEAMYTAIGYFSQDTSMRLNPSDFLVQAEVDAAAPAWATATVYAVGAKVTHDGKTYIANSAGTSCASCSGPVNDTLFWTMMPALMPAVADPVEAWCQLNNVLLISEGASTVDVAPDVVNFVAATSDADTDSGDCGRFKGSSYLDDLAWYGWNGDMWSTVVGKEEYSGIRSWIVESAERQLSNLAGECQPDQLLTEAAVNGGTNAKFEAGGDEVQFRTDLKHAFESILDRVSSGSAASIISASRAGEGALYQAIFWPDKETGRIDAVSGEEILVKWTGEVHAYLVDSRGNLYMDDCKDDTAGCHTGGLDAPVDADNDGELDTLTDRDTPIVAFYDQSGDQDTSLSTAEGTKACPASLEGGVIVFFDTDGSCKRTPIALENVDYLWSTTNWLNRDDVDSTIEYNRLVVDTSDYKFDFAAASSNPDKRFIFTWNDLNNDGTVDDSEIRDFEPGLPPMGSTSAGSLPAVSTGLGRGPVPVDFGVDPRVADAEDQVNNIIKWVRGEEVPGMRERLVPFDKNESGAIEADEYAVWKLGDVVHSTPISVASPAENYHQLYRDTSYAEFIARWQDRRHMVYFGANDGMLHAANGGFFDEDNKKFCREKDCGTATTNTPLLGAEMWAYVPYNLLPHLGCLTEPDYGLDPTGHKYFVDLRPRIFDVQIFDDETACTTGGLDDPGCIHPNGWGTILVGGMRFGGAEVRPGSFENDGIGDNYADTTNPFHGNGLDYDNRDFTSAYFVLDITDPERVPTLLGEFTRTVDAAGVSSEVELAYTTVISTMVPMKVGAEVDLNSDLVVDANEDKNCDGDNTDPEISKWYLILGSGPTDLDGTSSQYGSVSVVPLDRLISKDSVTDPKKDLRIPAALPVADDPFDATDDEDAGFGTFKFTDVTDANSFVSDTITVDMQIEADYLADVVYFGTVSGTWGDWGGKMYRLVTREECAGTGKQMFAEPVDWDLALLLDADKPIVAAPTVGTDGTDFWVYFGTGRFFDKDDKTDASSNATQTFYGIREPIDIHEENCNVLSWAEVLNIDPPFVVDPASNDPAQITGVDLATIPKTVFTAPTAGINRGELGLLPVGDIRILATRSQDEPDTLICEGDTGTLVSDNGTPLDPTDDIYTYNTVTDCLPSTVFSTATIPYAGSRSFRDLINTISGTSFRCGTGTIGTDGWYKDIPDSRERNLGQATLLGGLVSYTTYTPYDDVCLSEGLGYLYGVYYRTGTAWVEDVFGTVDVADRPRQENPDRMYLGKGLSTTPNIHIGEGEGGKAFVQTSVGQIVEIPQPNLPSKHVKSGRIKWRDIEQ